jgi:hypothetical protein
VVHLQVRSEKRIPDGLVVDLLPAGFELENQNLKHGVRLDDVEIQGKPVRDLRRRADIRYEEFLDDRYVAAIRLPDHGMTHLFYLVRVVSPGTFTVPPPFAESMYRPEIRGIGATPEPIQVINEAQ